MALTLEQRNEMISIAIRPQPFAAISFDLDDTLYDNRPILVHAEKQLMDFLAEQYPRSTQWRAEQWLNLKRQLVQQTPSLVHDTSAARLATLESGLQLLGYTKAEAKQGAVDGLSYFLHYRSNFTLSDEVLSVLKQLATRYRLIGITNGNVDGKRIGLGEVFEFVLHPGKGIRMKPYSDLFRQAVVRLDLTTADLLHVGDSYKADVQGARLAGCQAAWLNPGVEHQPQPLGHGVLPHIQLSQLSQLLQLL